MRLLAENSYAYGYFVLPSTQDLTNEFPSTHYTICSQSIPTNMHA